MYNKVLQNGYQVDNTKNNFDNSIMPILKNFYNSIMPILKNFYNSL